MHPMRRNRQLINPPLGRDHALAVPILPYPQSAPSLVTTAALRAVRGPAIVVESDSLVFGDASGDAALPRLVATRSANRSNKIRIMNRLICLLALCLLAKVASAGIMISVDPLFQTVTLGDQVFVDIGISGLGDETAPSLDALNPLRISYDTSILTATDVTFSTYFDRWTFLPPALTPSVDIEAASLDPPGDLEFQPDSFVMLTITFDSIASGTSDIEIAADSRLRINTDPGSDTIFPEIANGSVAVTSVIPEPTSLAIFGGLGVIGMVGRARRRQRKRLRFGGCRVARGNLTPRPSKNRT
jgi:hypothetical protein